MEPFGFFTFDALRAGWYLVWRQFVRIFPLMMGAVLIGWFLIARGAVGLGGFLLAIGLIVGVVWAAVLIPRLTSQWSEMHYGFPLTGGASVWWNVSWRAGVASFIAAIVLTPPQMVATSLTATFKGSALGGLGSLLTALLGVANFTVTLLASGWAMSRVALAQAGDFFERIPATPLSPLGPMVSEPTLEPEMATAGAPIAPEPHAAVAHAPMPERAPLPERAPMPERAVMAAPVAAPAMAARPAPAAVANASHEGKRQCPKCSLYETELGKVIGWYCRICGWRESRR